jgi:NAD+ synthase (glutamine-hydrolysing)
VYVGERTNHLFRLANQNNALVLGTGDLSELALGWCTYGVGDHMSHYNVNASVPKTLIQYVIAWVADRNEVGKEASPILRAILATEISPELVPPDDDDDEKTTTPAPSAPAPATAATSTSEPAATNAATAPSAMAVVDLGVAVASDSKGSSSSSSSEKKGKKLQSTQSIIGPYNLHDFALYHIARRGIPPSKVAFMSAHAWHGHYDLATVVHWLHIFCDRFFRTSQVDHLLIFMEY